MQTTSDATTWWQRAHGNDERELLVAYFSMEFGAPRAAADLLRRPRRPRRRPPQGGGRARAYRSSASACSTAAATSARGSTTPAGRPRTTSRSIRRRSASPASRSRSSVDLAGETIEAAVWRKDVGSVPLYLLEVDWLTDALYGGDREHRIRQELLLGVGGVRALAALGIEPTVFHLNEGHSAFLQIERVARPRRAGLETDEALEQVRCSSVFTTHTPVPAGNEVFDEELVAGTSARSRRRRGSTARGCSSSAASATSPASA